MAPTTRSMDATLVMPATLTKHHSIQQTVKAARSFLEGADLASPRLCRPDTLDYDQLAKISLLANRASAPTSPKHKKQHRKTSMLSPKRAAQAFVSITNTLNNHTMVKSTAKISLNFQQQQQQQHQAPLSQYFMPFRPEQCLKELLSAHSVETLPTILAFDVSGSMACVPRDVLVKAWEATLMRFLTLHRQILLVAFSDKIHVYRHLIDQPNQVPEAVQACVRSISGLTHMSECLQNIAALIRGFQSQMANSKRPMANKAAAAAAATANEDPLIWLITDGVETRSGQRTPTPTELLPEITGHFTGLQVQLSILGVGNSPRMELLMGICMHFGSEAMFVRDMNDLGRVLDLTLEYRVDQVSAAAVSQFQAGTVTLAQRLPIAYRTALAKDPTASAALTRVEHFLKGEMAAGRTFYPAFSKVFLALDARPLDQVRIVMLGQEPYCRANQSHGLAFSTEGSTALTSTLHNILNEVAADVGIAGSSPVKSGNLQAWAAQGVLLLNTVLTAGKDNKGSHQGKGWEEVTDAIIRTVSAENTGVVFMLWGRPAQSKKPLIDASKHLILEASNPSGLSASTAAPVAFLGCRHFSQANAYLTKQGKGAIVW